MSLFEELDIAGAEEPFGVPDNTYAMAISDVVTKPNKDGDMGMTITYTVTEGEYKGEKVTEYKRVPHKSDKHPLDDRDAAKARGWIKVRLESLGIPESRMNSIKKEDLIGTDCYVSTQRNGQYTNVRNVQLARPDNVADKPATSPFGG